MQIITAEWGSKIWPSAVFVSKMTAYVVSIVPGIGMTTTFNYDKHGWPEGATIDLGFQSYRLWWQCPRIFRVGLIAFFALFSPDDLQHIRALLKWEKEKNERVDECEAGVSR